MRIAGTLAKWNDERGFGFITPSHGGPDIFVHVSAFPKDGVRPKIGELLHFGIEDGKDGKKRATNLVRPQRAAATTQAIKAAPDRRSNLNSILLLVMFAVLAALAFYGYKDYANSRAQQKKAALAEQISPPPAVYVEPQARQVVAEAVKPTAQPRAESTVERYSTVYRCDGRTMCSQMNSCEEAMFFLKNCPAVKMDGDGDGIPCEQQWCGR